MNDHRMIFGIPVRTIAVAAHEFIWLVLTMFGAYLTLMAGWAVLARHG